MGNHRLIDRRTILALGLILLGLGIAGILYDATRLRFRQTKVPGDKIDQNDLLPPQPQAIPVSTPQALPKPGRPRSETQKSSRGTSLRVAKHHASRVQTPNAAGLWTSQNESTSVLDERTSDQAKDNTESQEESLSLRPTVVRQPSPFPSSRCTRLTRGEEKVGIFRGALNLIKRMLGLKPAPVILPNQPPAISSFTASSASITIACTPETHSSSGSCPANPSATVQLTATASDPDGDTLLFSYTATGGRITGEGANVSWDLSGVGPGTYTASVESDDGRGCIASASTTVTIANCADCVPQLLCPNPSMSCPDSVLQGQPIVFRATVTEGSPTFNWTVSAGTITSGQGTDTITVGTINAGGQTITATVELGGVDPSCSRTASCSTPVAPLARPTPTQTPQPTPSVEPSPGTRLTKSDTFPLISPTPTPTPFGQATPCASPTPVVQDFIEISYPESLLADSDGEVRVTLSSSLGKKDYQAERPGIIRRFVTWLGLKFGQEAPPTSHTGKRVDTNQPANSCAYDGSAKVELVAPKNLEVRQTEGQENDGYQRLDSADVLQWAWYVKHDKAVDSELRFRVYFRWKPKPNSGIPDNWPDKKVWPREDRAFKVSVYEPTIWNLMTRTVSWLSTGIGVTIMSIIIGPWVKLRYKRWRKKKSKMEDEEGG